MRIDFKGKLVDQPEIKAGFIGCGSHSFRNLYPTFQFAPVKLRATCDLDLEKARAFAAKFGAERAYGDHREMLAREDLDAVFICTGYDPKGRPLYPGLVRDCLEAGRHVWIEKPPAASSAEVEGLQAAERRAGRTVMVGFKKMFFPANEKARELISAPDFGPVSLATFQYPQYVPARAEFEAYLARGERNGVVGFLDHLCHPVSLMIYLLGMPAALYYQRSSSGSAAATFTFASGAVAVLSLAHRGSHDGGMERTVIVSESARHVVVDNNIRVSLRRNPPRAPEAGYGAAPDYFTGAPGEATACWEPEFSLGQLYNKGLFLLGYYNEVNEFARAILEKRPPAKGTLEQARQVTRIFEAFAQGPGRTIELQ
jgi:predicted dehydrogenase